MTDSSRYVTSTTTMSGSNSSAARSKAVPGNGTQATSATLERAGSRPLSINGGKPTSSTRRPESWFVRRLERTSIPASVRPLGRVRNRPHHGSGRVIFSPPLRIGVRAGSAANGLEHLVLGRRRGAVRRLELGQDVRDVGPHGLHRDTEVVGDPAIRLAGGDQLQHLPLTT